MTRSARAAGPYAVVAVALVLFLSWTLSRRELPGLAYDETIFVRAALTGDYPDRSFVHRDVFGVPVLLMPYIGALKSWVYAPIFAALGVSVDTIRVPVVLLSAGTILLAFVLARRLFGLWPAVFVAVLLSTDVAFAVMVKADWGPTAISAFLRVLALLGYFAFTRSGSVAAVWMLAASLGLGVFNKLDFFVVVVALAAAAVAVDRDRIAAAVRRRPAATLVPLALLGAWLSLAGLALGLPASRLEVSGADEAWGAHLRNLAELLGVSFSGEGQYEWMTGAGLPRAAWLSAALIATLAAVVVVLVHRLRADDRRGGEGRAIAALLVIFVVVLAGLAVTREVGGSHHVVLLWPLPYLLAAAAVRRPGAGRVAAGLFAAVALGSHVYVGAAYERAYARDGPWSPTWTPEIYAVADAVERVDADYVATVDWGVGQLFALVGDPARGRFAELWVPLDSLPPGAAAADAFVAEQLPRGRLVLVGRRSRTSAPGAAERLDAVLAAVGRSRVRPLFTGSGLMAVVVER